MSRSEREIHERAVRFVTEQAAKADELVDEAKAAGGGDQPVTVHAKIAAARAPQGEGRPRARALDVGAELHEVRPRRALGERPWRHTGHWAHREPAPHGEPTLYPANTSAPGIGLEPTTHGFGRF